jgi:hypothetical protein
VNAALLLIGATRLCSTQVVSHPIERNARNRKFFQPMSPMRFKVFALFAAAALLLGGCSDTPPYQGAAVDTDQNVLTGGPITGTTIEDLPAVVKDALKQRVPHDEISSIARTRRDGRTVYEISFLKSENPNLYLRDDGKVMPEPERAKK